MQVYKWQRTKAKQKKPQWYGNLDDDCNAEWAGLLLRAEECQDYSWWWVVIDLKTSTNIDAACNHNINVGSGEEARRMAESCALE
ncbi:hypothetical protein [Candidatus Uabimicrobium sp. HlEnr_7]|uniref:hypothetical protein n=1 Tax=Candidatus Uabimicrobium helgolandensis TaxID=3095367 RepID=UPI0035587011